MLDSKIVLNNIDVLVEKINNNIDEYLKEYYISPDRNISQEIYNNLQKAYTAFGKLANEKSAKHTVFAGFGFEYASKNLKEFVEEIVELILSNYDIKIANDTFRILSKLLFWTKDRGYLDYDKQKEISEIVNKIIFFSYLNSHKEYEKIKDLFDLYYLMSKNYRKGKKYLSKKKSFKENQKSIKLLLRSKVFFEEFNKKLSVIPTIEDKHFRSNICLYFKDGINVKSL